MRAPFFPLLVSLGAAATASAQTAQTTVDIGVSVPTFSKGVVQARVGRKDPSDAKVIAPDMKVRVTVAVKGDKPFYLTDVSLKSGGVQTISAPYTNDGVGVVFTVTANAIGVKELLPADNSRDSPPPLIAATRGRRSGQAQLPLPQQHRLRRHRLHRLHRLHLLQPRHLHPHHLRRRLPHHSPRRH
ncbi:MAG TPA: hypothetical protein VES88_15410 [Gemmatimonadaceae bacterium]|nr:hypothetical protein [Gemmatimonadaceae bacterium]